MSEQHKYWLERVKEEMIKQRVSAADLSILVGVSRPVITNMLNHGKASDRTRLATCKVLGITDSWRTVDEWGL